MPISGLVVVLSGDLPSRASAIDALEREPVLTMGVLQANRQAIVLETDSQEEDQRIWAWLHSLPGVVMVEVAFVGFENSNQLPNNRMSPPNTTDPQPTGST